jgi:hypothetical protein
MVLRAKDLMISKAISVKPGDSIRSALKEQRIWLEPVYISFALAGVRRYNETR